MGCRKNPWEKTRNNHKIIPITMASTFTYRWVLKIVLLICVVYFGISIFHHRNSTSELLYNVKPMAWEECSMCYSKRNISAEKDLIIDSSVQYVHIPSWKIPKCTADAANMTVVTAFIDVGPFGKGYWSKVRTKASYRDWMRAFALIRNPVIAFFNNQSDLDFFRSARRRHSHVTQVIKVDLTELRMFQLAPNISRVFQQPGYPKFHPNTVLPGYTCAVHSKYELMRRAATENPFRSQHFAWCDIGYFRKIANASGAGPDIALGLPPELERDKVGYMQIYERKDGMTVKRVFLKKVDWLAGGYFVAERSVMVTWCAQYMRFVEKMLARNLMNADQAIIYGMVLEEEQNPGSGQVTVKAIVTKQDDSTKWCPAEWMCFGYNSICI